jgi:uncharacterized protein (TIGR02145 family)
VILYLARRKISLSNIHKNPYTLITLTRTLLCVLLLFVTSAAWSQTAPQKPVLQSPQNQEPAYPYLNISFQWKADTGTPVPVYDLYLGTNPAQLQRVARDVSAEYFNDSLVVYQVEDTLYLEYFLPMEKLTTYYWKIVAKNGANNTTASDVWSFTIGNPNVNPPNVPANPFPANNAVNTVQTTVLKWGKVTDPDGDICEYDLYLTEGTFAATLVASGLTDTSFTVSPSLKGNTLYSWQIVAKDTRGLEMPGPVWKFTTRNTPPPVVTLLLPARQSGSVDYNTTFSWQKAIDADGDSVSYELWYGTNSTIDKVLAMGTATTVTLPLTGPSIYSWKVIAIDSRGDRSESIIWTFTTRNNPGNTAPGQPLLQAPVNASTGLLLQQTLQWNAVTDANGDPLNYSLYIGTSTNQLNLVATGLTTTSFAPLIQSNTTYYWKVEANDGKGGVTASAVWQFSTTTDDIGLTRLRLYYRYFDAANLFRFDPATLSPAFNLNVGNYTTKGKSIIRDAVAIVLDYTEPNATVTFDLPAGFTAVTPVIYGTGLPQATKAYLIEGTFAQHNIITVHVQYGAAKRSYTFDAQINQLPVAPILDLPANSAINVSTTPAFTWTGGDDTDGSNMLYRLMMGTTPNGMQIKATSNNAKSITLSAPLTGNQRYYWQIIAQDQQAETAVSETRTFVTVATPAQVLMPTPVYPREISTYVEHNPTLVWRASSDPSATYDVYLGYSNQPIRIAQGLTDTTYTLQGLIPDTTYYWKVVANAQGQSAGSAVRKFITQPANANSTGTMTDARDGQIYQWVAINGREWFVHNLAYLPQEKDGYFGYEPWKEVNDTKNYTVFLNNTANLSKYGYLYNWAAALNFDAVTDTTVPIQGVCPAGWHVATNEDWVSLYPITDSKPLMLHYDSWNLPARANEWRNRSGFSIVPAGFYNIFSHGYEDESYEFWLAQPYPAVSRQVSYFLQADKQTFQSGNNTIYGGASVRCVRNSPGNQAPTAPTLVNPVNNSANQPTSVSLQWTAAIDADGDAITYEVYVDTLPAPAQLAAVGVTATSLTYNSLIAGKTYYWKVKALDIHGESAESAIFLFTTQANSSNRAPSVPALLQPAHQNNTVAINSASLQWAASTDADGDAISYDVYLSRPQTPMQPLAKGLTTTSFTLGNLLNGVTYQWKIVANDGHGGITSSAVQTFTALNRPPTTPVLWSPVNGAVGQPTNPTVTWKPCTDPDGDRVSYRIMWGLSPTSMIGIDLIQQNMYTHTTTINNTTFYWQVIATDGKGGEAASEIRSYTAYRNESLSKVTQVSPVNFAANVSLNPQLNWKRVTLPSYTYSVYFGEGASTSLEASGLTDTFYVINQYNGASQLKPHTYYLWRIVATDPFGNIINSETWRIYTINNAPGQPALLSPANGANNVPNNITLNWGQATDPDGDILSYRLYFGTGPAANTLLDSGVQTGSYNLANLAIGATYYWKVTVKDAYGGENVSAVSSFTVPNNGQNHTPSAPVLTTPAAYTSGVQATNGLNWQAATDVDGDVLVYDVYLGTTSNLTTPVVTGTSSLQYLPSLTNGVTYYWKVVVHDGHGGSASSPVWSFMAKNNAPGVPVLVSPANNTVLTTATTVLTWNAATDPDNDPVVYDVYLDKGTQAAVRVASGLTTLSYTTPAISNNTAYYWKIVARDLLGAETASNINTFTGRNDAPSAPVLQLPGNNSAHSDATAVLTWSASIDPDGGPTAYEVYVGTTAANLQKTGTVYGTSFTTKLLNSNTTYYWKVIAKDPLQSQATSTTWSFNQQLTIPNRAPAAPALLSPANQVTNIAAQQVSFNWSAAVDPDGDPVTYDLYLATDAQASALIASSLTGTTYTASSLATGTAYYWKIVVSDDKGNSNTSAVNTFTTAQPPATTYKVGGAITGPSGNPLANVAFIGFTGSVTTNASGLYSTNVPAGWTGTITPVLAGYSFTPLRRTLTNVQANMDTQDFTATVITATNDPELDQLIKLYPNPTTGPVELSLPASLHAWYLELYDTKGMLLYSRKLNNATRKWQMQLPGKGLYLLRIRNNQRVVVKKLIAI